MFPGYGSKGVTLSVLQNDNDSKISNERNNEQWKSKEKTKN